MVFQQDEGKSNQISVIRFARVKLAPPALKSLAHQCATQLVWTHSRWAESVFLSGLNIGLQHVGSKKKTVSCMYLSFDKFIK